MNLFNLIGQGVRDAVEATSYIIGTTYDTIVEAPSEIINGYETGGIISLDKDKQNETKSETVETEIVEMKG